MKIMVGSRNSAKIGAVMSAATAYWPDAAVSGVDVESGVAGQPIGWEETIRGALNRAKAAYAEGLKVGASLGVGLEGGVVEMAGRTVLVGVVAVFDGERESAVPCTGAPLPDSWGKAILDGQELGPYLAEKFSEYNRKIGALPFVTNGVVLREDVFEKAVLGALAPWVNPPAFAA